MAKDPRSFFERLTGSVKIEDNGSEEQVIEINEPSELRVVKDTTRMYKKKPAKSIIMDDDDDAARPYIPQKADTRMKEKTFAEDEIEISTPGREKPVATAAPAKEEEAEVEGQLTVDIYDDGEQIVIQSTVAGVRPEDLDVSITNDMVTIKGRRRRPEGINDESYYYRELYWGPFSRSVILPEEIEVDRTDAALKNGLLTVKLPKKNKNVSQKIRVKME